jgi:hypothetical protein
MKYIVKLKRGPTSDFHKYGLKKYEIALNTDDNKTYIGDGDGNFIPLTDCERVNQLLFNNGISYDNKVIRIIPDKL